MATLDTASKAPLTVLDGTGADLGIAYNFTVEPNGIIGTHVADGVLWVSGEHAGTAVITATYAGQTGSLEVEVTAAPLTLSLGTAEPK